METIDYLRKLLPENSKVYTVNIRRTQGGKRLIKVLAIVDNEIRDISLNVARLLDLRRDDVIGGVWGNDAIDIVGNMAMKLYPDAKQPFYALRHIGV